MDQRVTKLKNWIIGLEIKAKMGKEVRNIHYVGNFEKLLS
jgi:hypothetical protein